MYLRSVSRISDQVSVTTDTNNIQIMYNVFGMKLALKLVFKAMDVSSVTNEMRQNYQSALPMHHK